MLTELAQLGIEIKADDIKKAISELDRLENQGKKTEGTMNKLEGAGKKLAAAFSILAGSALAKNMFETAASFETMTVSLKTVTGSAQGASDAMAMIKSLATQTPYQVSDLTQAFIKLKALGLDPSAAAITSYGNTASAMGKDLNQMIEAVADAATGEFERLKEFGIKSRSEGDNVSFTFQGVTKTVRKNAEDISKYLQDIGNVQFAGAMKDQMATLNGAISNLGDNWDNLLVTIADSGPSDIAKYWVGALSDGIASLTSYAQVATLEFLDLGSMLGAYAAIASKVLTLDFEGAGNIIDLRKQERAELDQKIAGIWKAKEAQDALNSSESQKATNQAAATPEHDNTAELLAMGKALREADNQDRIAMLEARIQEEENLERMAYAKKLLDEQQYNEQALEMARQQAQAKMMVMSQIMGNLSSLMNTKSRGLFEIGKAAAIAQAIINTHLAITKTMTSVPYPLNVPLAAAQGVAGFVQVNNIRGQNFRGQAHSGMDYVPREGSYILQRGEMVLDPGTSQAVRQNALGGGDVNVTNNINMTYDTPESLVSTIKSAPRQIVNAIVDAFQAEGRTI